MKWSKLKKLIEAFLADSLQNRIQYHVTRYGPGESSTMARGWITLDGKEIANFSSVEWLMQQTELASQIQEINHCHDFRNPDQRANYYSAEEQAKEITTQKGVFSRGQFYKSLEDYIQLPIDAALTSTNPIIQAIAMFDRRCGIHRLQAFGMSAPISTLVRNCYQIRCEAEGIKSDRAKDQ